MARLPRLAIAGHPHYLIQRGNNRAPIVVDDEDRVHCLQALREAAAGHGVAIHAYALLDTAIQLLATPAATDALGRMMQSLGRRYVAYFNRRHGRVGTLWEGRFRSTVLESERYFLPCMRHVESLAGAWSSAAQHTGQRRDPLVTDHPLYWSLGNTPFERELAWRVLLEQGMGAAERDALEAAATKGWVLGSDAFVASLSRDIERPLRPRPRGRPKSMSPIKLPADRVSEK